MEAVISRIAGHILKYEDFPVGRLVPLEGSYDSAESVLHFVVPSQSRAERVYGVEVDVKSGEIACACEAFDYKYRSKKGRETWGMYLEHEARAIYGKTLYPLVSRPPSGLCFHCRKVRAFLKRHHIFEQLEIIIGVLEARVEDKKRA